MIPAATVLADQVPVACVEPIGIYEFTLNPGERAVVPVCWDRKHAEGMKCTTHPEAQAGLSVLPGVVGEAEQMSLVVENESSLPITVVDNEVLAVGVEEEEIPTLASA